MDENINPLFLGNFFKSIYLCKVTDMYLFYENSTKTSGKVHPIDCFSGFCEKGCQRASPLKQGLRLAAFDCISAI